MNVSHSTRVQTMIDDGMRRGGFVTVDDLLVAALMALERETMTSDFAPGELDELLSVGDDEIERGKVIDGRQALEDRRRRRAEEAKGAG